MIRGSARRSARYFPKQLRERFDAELDTHPLRREIIATVVANDMINLGGITFAFRAMEETSATEAAVAKAFVALREIYELDVMVADSTSCRRRSPPNTGAPSTWTSGGCWTAPSAGCSARAAPPAPIAEIVARVQAADGSDAGPAAGLPARRRPRQRWPPGWRRRAAGTCPEDLAHRWAELFESFVAAGHRQDRPRQPASPVEDIAHVYYTVFNRFHADSLLERITKLPREGPLAGAGPCGAARRPVLHRLGHDDGGAGVDTGGGRRPRNG